MGSVWLIKWQVTLTIFCHNINVNSEIDLSTVSNSVCSKMENSRDKGHSFLAILTDLSKVFDYLLHDLLFAKLHAYGFDMDSLKLIYPGLCGRKQRVKINYKYSSWEEICMTFLEVSFWGCYFLYATFFYLQMIKVLPVTLMTVLHM